MYSIKSNKAKKLKGIRARLAMVYSSLFGLFICIFAYIISNQYLSKSRDEFDKALLNYAIDLSNEINFDESGMKAKLRIPESELRKSFPFAIPQTYYWVRSIDGRVNIEGRPGFPLKEIPYQEDFAIKGDYTHRYLSLKDGTDEYRALNLKISNPRGFAMILQVASSSNSLREQERSNLIINIVTIPLLILIASIASYLLADSAISPIQMVTDTANNIAVKNLSMRVPEFKTEDEVAELSKTFNTLLERLEKSFKAQEKFVANASHQLNTPLSIMKGELDVLESKPRSPEELIRFQKSLREELDRLIDLVKNMLLVSRVESGQDSFVFHPVRIDELLLSVSSRLAIKAKEKRIQLRFNMNPELTTTELEPLGEKQLLICLFENILDNAIKYAPEDSVVSLDIHRQNQAVEIWIQDEGPGIPEADFESVLKERYQRGEKNFVPGSGIGLPLAYEIALFHEAKISYRRLLPKGSLFIVGFPKQMPMIQPS